jgi:hypothetical protein
MWKKDTLLAILILIINIEIINIILQAILGHDLGAWLWNRITGL